MLQAAYNPTPSPEPDRRRAARAQVRATAIVSVDGSSSTEHMTCDLSVGGVRLCGLPGVELDDEVAVHLQLPQSSVRASGRLVRAYTTAGRPCFAIEFLDLSVRAEDAIQDAVVDALTHPNRRSVLLYRSPWEADRASWGWLDPIGSICETATSPLSAGRWLGQPSVKLGICSRDEQRPVCTWLGDYSKIPWRTIDPCGCLHGVG